MFRRPRLAASAVLGVLPLLVCAGALLGAGTVLSACDTGGCEAGMLLTEDVEVGDGDAATASSTVTVAYTATLEDGTVFDEATEEDPEELPLPNTIAGFREGLTGMREGGRRLLTIPPDLAYGEQSIPGVVPPCATLLFDVTLLEVE